MQLLLLLLQAFTHQLSLQIGIHHHITLRLHFELFRSELLAEAIIR